MEVQPLMFPYAGSGGQFCVRLLFDKGWHTVMFLMLRAAFSLDGEELCLLVGRQANLLHRES